MNQQEDSTYFVYSEGLDTVSGIVPEPMPADSAFRGGTFGPGSDVRTKETVPGHENGILTESLVIFSTVIAVIFIRKTVNIIPSMLSCMTRWKEAFNLEYSTKLSRDRDIVFTVLIMPFCLITNRYRIYSPSFTENLSHDTCLLVTVGATMAYIVLRAALFYLLKGKKVNPTAYTAAGKTFPTFFCAATLTCLLTGGLLSFSGLEDSIVKTVLLHILGAFYLLLVVRKIQIFSHSCKVLTTILYLCILELLPTGLLVASALIL